MWLCTQRRLRLTWASAQSDQSLLSAWRNLGPWATRWAHSEDSYQTGRMPRLIWVVAGHTAILLVLSCHGLIMAFCLKFPLVTLQGNPFITLLIITLFWVLQIISWLPQKYFPIVTPPTWKKWGILLLACASVHACVTPFYASCNLGTVHARVLKFHIWIPHGKIADPYF